VKARVLLALGALACDAGGPRDPEPRTLTVSLTDPHAIAPQALRFAVVWTPSDGTAATFVVSYDEAVAGPTSSFEIELALPSQDVIARLQPIERLQLAADARVRSVDAYRPRLVAYEDTDASGAFEPALLGSADSGSDSLLAIDSGSIAAILDLEAALRELPLEWSDEFYAASGGRFTPFVRVEASAPLLLSTASPDQTLELERSSFAALSLECLRPTFPESDRSTRVLVDSAVDPAVCAIHAPECESVDLSNTAPPELSPVDSLGLERIVQCQERAPLQSLVIQERRPICEACDCTRQVVTSAYIADQSFLPPWWPCGTTVGFCPPDFSFIGLVVGCDGLP
jgi:hypothetical protein